MYIMSINCEHHTTIRPARITWVAWVCMLLGGCQPTPSLQTISGEAQGTTYRIHWWSKPAADPAAVHAAVELELTRLDRLLSNYRPDSTIEQFGADRSGAPFEVGPEIVRLLSEAGAIARASDGCYDPSIKPLFDLWGFRDGQLTPPSAEQLAQALAGVGMAKLRIIDATHVQKTVPDLQVDLASIAQGYSIERLAQVLENAGAANYLVELGGEMLVRGHKPDGGAWRVALERPLPGQQRWSRMLEIAGDTVTAVMASGTYRHYFDAGGRRYSHILDARDGLPVSHDTVSVTVVHGQAGQADAWSTALLCLGAGPGRALAERQRLAALFVEQRDGRLIESASSTWRMRFGTAPTEPRNDP